jgi:tetratricopeptide (TPR) repeat protein
MAQKANYLVSLLLVAVAIFPTGCNLIQEHQTFAQKAEAAAKTGDLDGAINNYYLHIQSRLKEKDRPEWENPYFYFLLIGDLYVQKNDPISALAKYDAASEKNVDPRLVGDRVCLLSRRLEAQGKFSTAYKILVKRHQLNPELFDIALNRVARALAEEEDKVHSQIELKTVPNETATASPVSSPTY